MQVLHLWSQRHRKSLVPEFLMSKVLLWQRAGYVSKDVWNEMNKIVGAELLPSQQEINEKSDMALDFEVEVEEDHVTYVREKLHRGYLIMIGLSNCAVESIYPSKRKSFALHALGLEESEYDKIITETIGARKRNLKVVFENGI